MSSTDYIIHMFRRLQANNFDVSALVSGAKGFGKSTAAIWLSKQYVDMFGFICPNCGADFYKSVYSIKKDSKGNAYFEIPEYVFKDKASIQCPVQERLNIKTGQKEHVRGCGHKFKW